MANKNVLSQIEMTHLQKNMFDLSHEHKLSCNMAELVPVYLQECIPGDKFITGQEALVRLAPMVAPMMHRVDVTFHTFFCPNRLVWAEWENFIMNKPSGGSVPVAPTFTIDAAGGNYTRLMNFMGIPDPRLNPTATEDEEISAIPFSIYQKIYNEYYRDQNLIAENIYDLNNGDNTGNIAQICKIHNRAWEHDYFTSALPTSQFGAAVTIPIAGFNDVEVKMNRTPSTPGIRVQDTNWTNGASPGDNAPPNVEQEQATGLTANSLFVDGSEFNATQTTITDLRIAFRLQEWAEKMMRGGRRFVEYLGVMFGIRNLDARLQRPQYITGSKSPVVISEVLNTTGTADAPQGNMAGHGISVVSSGRGGYFVPEHGFIITLMSVMPKTGYQQGLAKHWLKRTFTDYYTPQFANVGEQEIVNRELYAYEPTGGETFGYTPRYAEYKYAPNRVSGDFQDDLDFWTLNRKFATPPALNQTFIECTPAQTMRVFAVTDPNVDHLWIQIYNKVKSIRPMPVFGTPSL